MLRSSLAGHADFVMDRMFPYLPRHSTQIRYIRPVFAFFLSGMIHSPADQRQGVPNDENGALTFFLLHAAAIILEDAARPVATFFPLCFRYIMGYLWVLIFFVWSSPVYMYPGIRLGYDAARLLPVRFISPYLSRKWSL